MHCRLPQTGLARRCLRFGGCLDRFCRIYGLFLIGIGIARACRQRFKLSRKAFGSGFKFFRRFACLFRFLAKIIAIPCKRPGGGNGKEIVKEDKNLYLPFTSRVPPMTGPC